MKNFGTLECGGWPPLCSRRACARRKREQAPALQMEGAKIFAAGIVRRYMRKESNI